jgi:hypothetical protein
MSRLADLLMWLPLLLVILSRRLAAMLARKPRARAAISLA